MASFNKVILMGNLTRDPELKYTPGGTAVAEVGLAMNRKYKSGEEMKEEVCFVDITFWGKMADTVCQYLRKGSPLHVEGRLQLDQWEKDGQKRSKLRVVGEGFQFVGSKSDGEKQAEKPAAEEDPFKIDDEDNIPF